MYHRIAVYFYGIDHRYRCSLPHWSLRHFLFRMVCSSRNGTTEWLGCRHTCSSDTSNLFLGGRNPVRVSSAAHVRFPCPTCHSQLRGSDGLPDPWEDGEGNQRRWSVDIPCPAEEFPARILRDVALSVVRPRPHYPQRTGRFTTSNLPSPLRVMHSNPPVIPGFLPVVVEDFPDTHCSAWSSVLLPLRVARPFRSRLLRSLGSTACRCNGASALRSTACTRSVVPSQRWNSASIVTSVGAGRIHLLVAVKRNVPT